MDLNRYRLLLNLAETRNITRTAENLGYSQPGVSHIIKGLEKEMGFPLVIREKYGVVLTPAAELLLPRIRDIVTADEKLEQTIYSINGLECGKITIGTYSSVAIHLLPRILSNFRKMHPDIDIYVREGGADNIVEWMSEKSVDFAFLSQIYVKGTEFIPFGKDPLLAVLPLDYKLQAGQEKFDIRKFEGQDFIISAIGNDFDVHHALEESDVHPRFRYSVLDDHSILSMVENHLGISILSRLIVTGYEERVKLLPLNPGSARELGIGFHAYEELSPAARTFVDYARNNLRISYD